MKHLHSELLSASGVLHGFGLAGISIEYQLESLGLSNAIHFQTDQMHSDGIVSLESSLSRTIILEADAFVTNEPGVVCFVRTADCTPILIFDPAKRVVAAVHAGWRGTAKNIAAKTVRYFAERFGSKPSDILAAIGPAIGGNCYEVGDDVAAAFKLDRPNNGGRHFINLPEINRRQLREAGVAKTEHLAVCTHCDSRFASYRRDKTEQARQVNFISLPYAR